MPSEDGASLAPYTGADASQLTVGGELNKLACNIYQSRDFAGVHYRSDGLQGLLLGEAVAISILEDQARTYNEDFAGFTFTKFDGTKITVGGNTCPPRPTKRRFFLQRKRRGPKVGATSRSFNRSLGLCN
jgi:hypothetical protein